MMTRQWANDKVDALLKKDNKDDFDEIMLGELQRELIFLNMINLDKANICRNLEDVKKDAEDSEIIVLKKGEFGKMKRAYDIQSEIKALIDSY